MRELFFKLLGKLINAEIVPKDKKDIQEQSMPHADSGKGLIRRKVWLDTKTLSGILGIKQNSVDQAIRRGKFTKIRKVPGKGRSGKVWQVNIMDPAITEKQRKNWLNQFVGQSKATDRQIAQATDRQTDIKKLL